MTARTLYRMLARYNVLANERLFDACASLGAEELAQPRLAFFGSIIGTLNHILIGDRIWLDRFSGREVPSTDLDAVPYPELWALREARSAEDARILRFTDGLTPKALRSTITYVNNRGIAFEDSLDMLILHFFNHQTHHRGQVHDMLCQTAVPPPVLDLHRVLKPNP